MQNITAGHGTAESTGTASSSGVATDETEELISSNKVEGTAVYNREGERLGTISSLMVNKFTGQVAYTIMSFGLPRDRPARPSAALESALLRH